MFTTSRRSMIARLALLGAASLVTMGAQSSCSSTNGEGRFDIQDPPENVDGPTFTTTLVLKDSAGTVRSSFQRGELLTMELSVRNRTSEVQRVTFSDGAQSDFIVFNDGTHQLRWRWTEGKVFTQATTEVMFEPQETRKISVTWDQVLASGAMVEAGAYEARGMMMIPAPGADLQAPHERASTLVPFTITP
jgi:hypothetical protein